jgi:hypothetical protein
MDWRKGKNVAENIPIGTPIATFMDRNRNQSDKYDGGEGVGKPGNHTTHAAIFNGYIKDNDGKIIGITVKEQYQGSNGVQDHTYMFGAKGGGTLDGSNYYAINDSQGTPLGKNNPLVAQTVQATVEASQAAPVAAAPAASSNNATATAAATAAPPPVAAAPAPGATNTAARGAEITKPYVATPKDGKGPNILMGEAGLETVVPNNKIKAESVGEQPFQRPPIQSKPPENVEPTKQSPPQNGMTSYSSEQPTTQVLMDHPIPNNSMLYALIEANGNEIGSVHILNNGYFLHSFGFA